MATVNDTTDDVVGLFNTLEKSFTRLPSPCATTTFQLKPQKDITSWSAAAEESATEPLFCPVTGTPRPPARWSCARPLTLGWFLGGTSTLELTAQTLLLFIWLLVSTIRSFSPSICTGSLIITLFALYIIITAYLELSPWTTQAAEDTQNSQADIGC